VPIVAVYATDLPAYAHTYHAGALGESFAWWRLKKIHNAADLTLSPSTATAADLRAHGIERVKVWGRGVDCRRFDPAKRSARLHADLADGADLVVGYVGRLAAEKRLDLLTNIAAMPGVRVVIVGSGPAEAAIRRMVPSAVFLGQRGGEDLATIYASLDVFVHAGPHDTFGQTLQEAAASGLPVVAAAAGGPLDLVREGVTGFLVKPGDAGLLADAVGTLLADPALRAAQGVAARQTVLGRTWPVMCDQLLDHYADVLGTGTSVARQAVAA
jgi:phosphatidylinositol alpha 1,6-mannosyltransferase